MKGVWGNWGGYSSLDLRLVWMSLLKKPGTGRVTMPLTPVTHLNLKSDFDVQKSQSPALPVAPWVEVLKTPLNFT